MKIYVINLDSHTVENTIFQIENADNWTAIFLNANTLELDCKKTLVRGPCSSVFHEAVKSLFNESRLFKKSNLNEKT